MIRRTFCALLLTLPLLGAGSGCDNKPKFVMPTEKAPPAPRPHVAGPGSAPAEPGTPNPDANPMPTDPKKPPADSMFPEDKK